MNQKMKHTNSMMMICTERIIAMDNVLATKSTKFTVDEQRLFYITLASIKPNQKSNEIEISKKQCSICWGLHHIRTIHESVKCSKN